MMTKPDLSSDDFLATLSENEARKLIEQSGLDSYLKACRMHSWQRLHRISSGETRVTAAMTETFDAAWTLDEYREIIKICLMDYCDWSEFWNRPERVDASIKRENAYIERAYRDHETPMDAAVDVGFCCG